jgi:phosphatidate cytidylyltransferase
MMSKKKSYYIFGFIFLIFSFYTVYQLRNNFYGNYIYFIMILIICVFSDIGGYTFGKIFKGPKLTKFSPNKTYSGMIGSYLFAIIATSLFFNNLDFFKNTGIQATSKEITLVFLIFVLFVSTISQLGDIMISYFKRLSKIKDTGKIIPGHGGLLDRVDGMVFAFPFSYIILEINVFQYF